MEIVLSAQLDVKPAQILVSAMLAEILITLLEMIQKMVVEHVLLDAISAVLMELLFSALHA